MFRHWIRHTFRSTPSVRQSTLATTATAATIQQSYNMSATTGNDSNNNIDYKSMSNDEWKQRLTTEQFNILRLKGTEYPGTGEYNKETSSGVYNCIGCNTPLYTSTQKFDSGCGWPAFFDAIPGAVKETTDAGMLLIYIIYGIVPYHNSIY